MRVGCLLLLLLLFSSSPALAQSDSGTDAGEHATAGKNASVTGGANAAAAATTGPKPLPTLEVGTRIFSNVTLKSSDGVDVTITYDAGIKTIPLMELSLEQMKALNGTTTVVSIDLNKVGPNPPSPEAFRRVEGWITQAKGLNQRLEDGNTPLIEAVLANQPDCVKVLIKKHADLNATSKDGHTAWKEAATRGYNEITLLLEKAGAKVPTLLSSAQTGDVETFNLFLSLDPKAIETRDPNGLTLLMVSAHANQVAIMDILVAKGAELEVRDKDGFTALFQAVTSEKREAARFLIEKGADVNTRLNDGKTPLMAAAETGSTEMIKLLLDHGASVRVNDRQNGWNALMHAVKADHAEAVEMLLAQPVRIDAVDRNGKTARRLAEDARFDDVVKMLANAEANIESAKLEKQKSIKRVMGSELAAQGEEDIKSRTVPPYVPYLIWAGLVVAIVGHIWITLVAIQDGVFWGLLVLFFNPLGGLVYCFTRVRGAVPVYAIYLIGLLMMGVPAWMFDVNLIEFFFMGSIGK